MASFSERALLPKTPLVLCANCASNLARETMDCRLLALLMTTSSTSLSESIHGLRRGRGQVPAPSGSSLGPSKGGRKEGRKTLTPTLTGSSWRKKRQYPQSSPLLYTSFLSRKSGESSTPHPVTARLSKPRAQRALGLSQASRGLSHRTGNRPHCLPRCTRRPRRRIQALLFPDPERFYRKSELPNGDSNLPHYLPPRRYGEANL